jgi:heme/copper-type cytochrome/quinol oxidase subunit 3
VVLLTSSVVLEWGGRQIKQQRYRTGRSALIGTILLGVGFLILQIFEYKSHWKELTPDSNSYGSIFYTITSFHAAHVVVGLLILCFVAALPQYAPTRKSPYRRYKTASLYWHFVDAVWVFIVLFLYIIPNLAHG